MSRTGRYVWGWDEEKQKMTWIQRDNKVHTQSSVYFPKDCSHSGAHFENLDDKTFYSPGEKREYMKEKGIAEAG